MYLEIALITTVRRLLPSAALAIPLLAVPRGNLLVSITIQLSILTILMYALADKLVPMTSEPWFGGSASIRAKRFGTAAAASALVTGFGALVGLATAAALRFQPSLQFLALISALDIAWVVTATMVGTFWLAGRRASRIAGAIVGAACVFAFWRYLYNVGFTETGGWLLTASDLNRYVLPFDVAAAVIAIGVVLVAIRKGSTFDQSPVG